MDKDITDLFGGYYGTIGQLVYENGSYKVEIGVPPGPYDHRSYPAYLIINKSNGVVENTQTVLAYAQDAADGMHKILNTVPEQEEPAQLEMFPNTGRAN